ncbi:hypothetical protein BLA29_014059, partial [Euroglyphus maynei]
MNEKVKRSGEQPCISNDDDGHCFVNNDWNNVTTFDGYNYRFNNHNGKTGLCNRVLAKDSYKRRFSLHLLHRYRRHSKHQNKSGEYIGASLL